MSALATLSPSRRRRLADHLRVVDRLEAAAYATSTPDDFYEVARALAAPADKWACAFAIDNRLIRVRHMTGPVGAVGQHGFTLNGTGRDWLVSQREPLPNPWLPTREPLMGERQHVASLAVAA